MPQSSRPQPTRRPQNDTREVLPLRVLIVPVGHDVISCQRAGHVSRHWRARELCGHLVDLMGFRLGGRLSNRRIGGTPCTQLRPNALC